MREGQGFVSLGTSGVLLAAHVSADNTSLVANELRRNGAQDVERAEGQWRDGRWDGGADPRREGVAVSEVR